MKAFLLLFLFCCTLKGAGLGVYNPAQHAVNGFMPTQLPGLALWIEAGKTGLTNGASVSFVQDYGPSSANITNSGGSKKPTLSTVNGRPAFKFDGVDDYLATISDLQFNFSQMSYALSLIKLNTNDVQVVFEHGPNANTSKPAFGCFVNDNLGDVMFIEASISTSAGFNAASIKRSSFNNSTFIFTSVSDTSLSATLESSVYANGNNLTFYPTGFDKDSTGNISTNRILYIGARSGTVLPFQGFIGEIVICGVALNNAQRIQLERYLGTKYGIVVQ